MMKTSLPAGPQQGSPGFVLQEKCPYCSKWRHPREVMKLGTGGVKICWHCWEWHRKALAVFAGAPPPGCQECGVTFAALMERAPDGNVGMYLQSKDGVYQILCRSCSSQYVRKRVDLYGDTLYGDRQKLKGTK